MIISRRELFASLAALAVAPSVAPKPAVESYTDVRTIRIPARHMVQFKVPKNADGSTDDLALAGCVEDAVRRLGEWGKSKNLSHLRYEMLYTDDRQFFNVVEYYEPRLV